MGIDPCVLVDDDGKSYIYWSGMGMKGAQLADNMMQALFRARHDRGLARRIQGGTIRIQA